MDHPREHSAAGERVLSIDVLRGLTILLMVFVNDLGPAAPGWMLHIQPPNADGMTLADVVFPGFLFISGVSIPLAVDRARRQGATTLQLAGHTVLRGASLLLMGVVEFNRDDEVTLGPTWWGLLTYVAMILAWCVVPREPGSRRTVLRSVKIVGILGLLALLALYRRDPVDTHVLLVGDVRGWVWLRTGWWGILGLIGWAWLMVSLLYLVIGRRREWLMGAVALLMCMYLAQDHGGFFTRIDDKPWLKGWMGPVEWARTVLDGIDSYVSMGSVLGSLPAITMCGCLLGTILIPDSGITEPASRLRWGLGFALGLFVAGLMTDTFAGINKIGATPTWCLWCASLTCLVWVALYQVLDRWGWTGWSGIVRPAGANPLIAYFLHPILIWILSLSGLYDVVHGYSASSQPLTVVLGSAAMALAVCTLTLLLVRAGLRMRI